jgi:hypothetical protein
MGLLQKKHRKPQTHTNNTQKLISCLTENDKKEGLRRLGE